LGGFCGKSRKNLDLRPLLARISTTVDICEAKGGGTHDTIVRGIAADDEGQAIVEYAVILVIVAVGAVFGYQLVGGKVADLINSVVTAFS
jgi:Flp pilus assembly pilin Flp